MSTFVLPDILRGYLPQKPCFYYAHQADEHTSRSRLHFTTYCITIIKDGIKHIRSMESVTTITSGSVVFFKPGNYMTYETLPDPEPYRSLLIFVQPETWTEIASLLHLQQTGTKNPVYKPFVTFPADMYLTHFMTSLNLLSQASPSFTDSLQKIKLQELVGYLLALYPDQVTEFFRASPTIHPQGHLQMVVENNIYSELTLEELAFLCHMSLATFKRRFEKLYGDSPGNWLKKKRLQRAAFLLATAQATPTEVFYQTGYKDYSSFSYAFKQELGACPKTYQKTTDELIS